MRKDIITYFIGKLLPMLVNLSFVILGVRYLGKAEYGKFSLIYSSLFTFYMLLFGWVQQGILRFNTENDFSKNKISFFFSISFWMSVLLFFLMIFTAIFYFKTSFIISLLIGACSFFFIQLFYFLVIYQSIINSKSYVITESIFYVLWLGITAFLVFLSYHDYWVGFLGLFLALIIVVLYLYSLNLSNLKILSLPTLLINNKSELMKMLNYGLPIALWLFISSAFNFADRFILKQNYGYAEAGLYSTVYDLFFKIATFVCMPFLLTNHSLIVNNWNEKKYAKAWTIIKTSISIELSLMIFTLIGLSFFGQWALMFLTGIKLEHFNSIVLPIVSASFIWQIGMFVHKPLELYFKQWFLVIGVLIALVSNLILNSLFIPEYKFEAAAYSTLISTIIYVLIIVTFIFIKKYHTLNKVENNP